MSAQAEGFIDWAAQKVQQYLFNLDGLSFELELEIIDFVWF